MSDKRISDRQEEPVEPGVEARAEVNRSRRRFTSAGLTASAILTLANRPAFGTACADSASTSGNLSKNGGVAALCEGSPPDRYLDKVNWPSGFYSGERNPLVTSHVSHAYPEFSELESAIEREMDVVRRDECIRYRDWAWPSGTSTSIPAPVPAPNLFNSEFSGTGLIASDATMTLMQALEEFSDDVPGHAVAGLFNCYTLGEEVYGYHPATFRALLRDTPRSDLLALLRRLNNR